MNAVFFLYAASALVSAQPAEVVPGPSRGEVVAALKHHEGLVRTLQVDYEFTMLPTPPRQAELIREALGKTASSTLFTAEEAKVHSGVARFWRKGAKQRNEWSSIDPSQPQERRRAFDGQVIRSVNDNGPDGLPVATIASADSGDWYRSPWEDPMEFFYDYYQQPLSEVVAAASSFSSAVVMRGKQRLYWVSVERARPSDHVLEFLFDEQFLPQERLVKIWSSSKRDRLVYNHKLVFSGYQDYATPSGEKISFPDTVDYTGYTMRGTLPDGSPLETLWKKYHFTKVQFNSAMPDSLFELEIPKNARIYDRLTKAGWLPTGQRPEALFPAEARARRLWIGGSMIAALVLVLVTTVVIYKRRKRSPYYLGR